MPRNRQLTESRILEAALRILRRDGFEGWGVNHVAREAGVDKVLIYRYFDGIEGLLDRIIESIPFWPRSEILPYNSAEACIESTLSHFQEHPEILLFLTMPAARTPVSSIRRKYARDLQLWLDGFRDSTLGSINRDQLERLPSMIVYQALTGQENLSAHDLWLQVSPPLSWKSGAFLNDEPEELPPEML